jgi:hypothetical protein
MGEWVLAIDYRARSCLNGEPAGRWGRLLAATSKKSADASALTNTGCNARAAKMTNLTRVRGYHASSDAQVTDAVEREKSHDQRD